MRSNQKGFGVVEVLLGCSLLVLIIAGGWWMTHNANARRMSAPHHAPTQQQTTGYLVIKEWQAKLPLTAAIKDAYYTHDQGNGTVTITTRSLDALDASIQGCKAGLTPYTYERLKPGDRYVESSAIFDPTFDTTAHKVGDYYVRQVRYAISACAVPTSTTTEQAATLLYELSAQVAKLVPADS